MKQIFQNLRTGEVTISEIPTPGVKPGHLLIKSRMSLVSAGTERMVFEFGKAGWVKKALQQPEKVKQVIKNIKQKGLQTTIKSVSDKLDLPLPIGYCNTGVVIECGAGVKSFQPGCRVISNGHHAEVVLVPENLCAKIPDGVSDVESSFTVLSSVALQGVRLANPTLGESVAVIGLGLLGLITCQILKANGCKVIGFDLEDKKVALARKFGAEAWNLNEIKTPVEAALAFSSGRGVDSVLITASTQSNDPIEHSPAMCRKRGKVVLVGVVGLNLNRQEFYEKEISFQVSCSYGPGRYDYQYEQKGQDYPIGFVRWTEQRNFEAVLQLMLEKKLIVDDLVSKVVSFEESQKPYGEHLTNRNMLGLVLDYPQNVDPIARKITFSGKRITSIGTGNVNIGVIGAGNFTGSVILPALAKTKANLIGIASSRGVSSANLGRKYNFIFATTDYREILTNDDINSVVITTQHDTHEKYVVEALEAGKHVFVEKPLTINAQQLNNVEKAMSASNGAYLMVGFNRRFSPHAQEIAKLLKERQSPIAITMTINAGSIPGSHWVQDPERGGGRIIGEACHFIDLMVFFTNSPVKSVSAIQLGTSADGVCDDKMCINLKFGDGSIGTINYFANGHKDIPKERMEIFSDGRILYLEDFKVLTGYGFKNFKKLKFKRQDKGHENEIGLFVDKVMNGGTPLIQFEEIINSSLATFAALESAKMGKPIAL